MRFRSFLTHCSLLIAHCFLFSCSTTNPPPIPPSIPREFRGVWVATVNNIDWPSSRHLSVAEQQRELLAILDRAGDLHFNAVIFQVRPAADAVYPSALEPWSEYLTGTMGLAPEPFYDPLAFAVEAAHARGLELHAWFNPYRARHSSGNSPVSEDHISRLHPEQVVSYGDFLWMDPGSTEVQEHSIRVILDVVHRYDIDGVHLDDYFYPYPIQGEDGTDIEFPDDRTWNQYVASGGALSRGDWRRRSVDAFVETLYGAVKRDKPWVRVGISPFGIWRPHHPPGIVGFDAWDKLYADSRKWLTEGWVDYFAPQLYWPIERKELSFTTLLEWWQQQNVRGVHIWPGVASSRVASGRPNSVPAMEIIDQIAESRRILPFPGTIHFSMRSLMENRGGLADRLKEGPYSNIALAPRFERLGSVGPPVPAIRMSGSILERARPLTPDERWWVISTRSGSRWETVILPATFTTYTLVERADEVMVFAVSRTGIESSPVRLRTAEDRRRTR